jgi:hypothetical protein
MTEQSPPWPKQGPSSYFPSIEKKYGHANALVGWALAGNVARP